MMEARDGSEPTPVQGVRFMLAGMKPVISATDHGRGLTPFVAIYDGDGDEASFPINVDWGGDAIIGSKVDPTGAGYVVVIRQARPRGSGTSTSLDVRTK